MNKSKAKILRNHIPTVKHLCEIFLNCLTVSHYMDDESEKKYLLELIDEMEKQLAGAKETLEE